MERAEPAVSIAHTAAILRRKMNCFQLRNEKGQTLTEYALILLLIALVVALAIPAVSTALCQQYTAMAASFP